MALFGINPVLNDLLITPVLEQSLDQPVDCFEIDTPIEGTVGFYATLKQNLHSGGFVLEVRDHEGRDLSQMWPDKNNNTQVDTVTARGRVQGRLPVEFLQVWPSNNHTIHRGDTGSVSTAIFSVGTVSIPPLGTETKTITELFSGKVSTGLFEFEHIALFSNTKIFASNTREECKRKHPYWSDIKGSGFSSWDGAFEGCEYSIAQQGKDLKVGLRQNSTDLETACNRFRAFLKAVAFLHAINDWPIYIEHNQSGLVCERVLKTPLNPQGAWKPFWERHAQYHKEAPDELLRNLTLFLQGEGKREEQIKKSMWLLRGIDCKGVSMPTQKMVLGSIIEGLLKYGDKAEVPEAFTKLKDDALTWVDAQLSKTEDVSMVRRLEGQINSWNYIDRKVQWESAFLPLFPGNQKWVQDLHKVYQKCRHPVAHGEFSSSDGQDALNDIENTGKLAGFILAVIAAKSGYVGRILKSPYQDQLLEIGESSFSQNEAGSTSATL